MGKNEEHAILRVGTFELDFDRPSESPAPEGHPVASAEDGLCESTSSWAYAAATLGLGPREPRTPEANTGRCAARERESSRERRAASRRSCSTSDSMESKSRAQRAKIELKASESNRSRMRVSSVPSRF